ncbi:hypothetical protein EGW08_016695, partial [Elysia chlorotica]
LVPACSITDAPRFEYRGFMLDMSRNFHTEQELRTLIEAMALYKLNKLHLHLSDDEGWRLEIRPLPELTQLGGIQCYDPSETRCLMPELGGVPQGSPKFLTAAQYSALLDLASSRHVTIIPEIDMPGHARAAIKSMELRMARYPSSQDMRLTEASDTSRYLSNQMFNDNALNPCLASVWNFVKVVMDELIRLHREAGQPLATFHFGGDEVAAGAWVNSTSCQLLRESGQLPEDSVKAYLMQVGQGLGGEGEGERAERGHEVSQSPVESITGYAWSDVWDWGMTSRTHSLANAGYKVIMAPASHVFFDHPQEPDPVEGGNVWAARYIDAFKTFSFMPFSYYDNAQTRLSGKAISKEFICKADNSGCPELKYPENVIGMKGVLKSLMIKSVEQFEGQAFPRLLALAERAWHAAPWEAVLDPVRRQEELVADWARFANSLGQGDLALLDAMGVTYRVPPPGVRRDQDRLLTNVEFPGLKVQFRVEGVPDSAWLDLTPDIKFDADRTVLLRTVSPDGRRVSREVKVTTASSSGDNNSRDGTVGLSGSRSTVLVIVSVLVVMVTVLTI